MSLPLIPSKRSRLNPISGGHRPTLAGSARFSRAVHGFVPTFRIDLHRRAAAVVENSMTSSPTRVRGLRAPGAQARTLSLGVSPGAPPADTLGFDSEGCQGFGAPTQSTGAADTPIVLPRTAFGALRRVVPASPDCARSPQTADFHRRLSGLCHAGAVAVLGRLPISPPGNCAAPRKAWQCQLRPGSRAPHGDSAAGHRV